MESSGRADFRTVPGFAFRATFDVDIEGLTLLKVLLASTILTLILNMISGIRALHSSCNQQVEQKKLYSTKRDYNK